MRCRYIATLLFLQLLQVCDCVEWQHCLYFIPEDVVHEAGSAITTNPKSAVLKRKKKSRLPLSKWIEKKTPSWTRRTRRQTVQTASVDVATDASSPDTPGPCVKKKLEKPNWRPGWDSVHPSGDPPYDTTWFPNRCCRGEGPTKPSDITDWTVCANVRLAVVLMMCIIYILGAVSL